MVNPIFYYDFSEYNPNFRYDFLDYGLLEKNSSILSEKSRKGVFLQRLKIAERCINNPCKNRGKVNYETKNIRQAIAMEE